MSVIKDENKILNRKKQLPELDDEMDLIREKISKMTIDELWGQPSRTLIELLNK